jgi:zinc/manganese transport system permease protein
MVFGASCSVVGLLLSYHFCLPSGPAIILTASAWYLFSVFAGSSAGLGLRLIPHKHHQS